MSVRTVHWLPLNVKNLLRTIGYRLEHSAERTGGESQIAS